MELKSSKEDVLSCENSGVVGETSNKRMHNGLESVELIESSDEGELMEDKEEKSSK